MHWWRELKFILDRLIHRSRAERELDEEICVHREMEIEQNMAAGMSPEEARITRDKFRDHGEQLKYNYSIDREYYRELESRIVAIPGVLSVSFSQSQPIGDDFTFAYEEGKDSGQRVSQNRVFSY